jgi:hypothetical protein
LIRNELFAFIQVIDTSLLGYTPLLPKKLAQVTYYDRMKLYKGREVNENVLPYKR